MIYADIIIDISSDKLDRSFQYRVPERLEKKIKAGMVAAIPFGNAGRVRKGYVIGLSDKPKIAPEKIKEISESSVSHVHHKASAALLLAVLLSF